MKLEFFLPMRTIPTVTSQEKGVNFNARKIYTKDEVKAVRQKYLSCLAGHRPAEPLIGPIGLLVLWNFPADKRHGDGQWKLSRPDTDNMIKLLKDCMTELGYWADDAQVCYEVSMKKYADLSGVYISVLTLGGDKNETTL